MGEVNATMTGAPIYTASFNANQTFPMEGPWTIQVEVDRPGQQSVQFTFHVVVTQ